MELRRSYIINTVRSEKMSKILFAGSFDPITIGHINLIERAAKLFDEIVVVIFENSEKKPYFSSSENLHFIKQAIKHIPSATCAIGEGLTIHYAEKIKANALLRGVRNEQDFLYEQDLAKMNAHINPQIETILLFADPILSHISSSFIKELFYNDQDVQALVHQDVLTAFKAKRARS